MPLFLETSYICWWKLSKKSENKNVDCIFSGSRDNFHHSIPSAQCQLESAKAETVLLWRSIQGANLKDLSYRIDGKVSRKIKKSIINFNNNIFAIDFQLHSNSSVGIFWSRSNDSAESYRTSKMPMAYRRTRLCESLRRQHSHLRLISADLIHSRRWHHCSSLSWRRQFIRECLHQNIRSLCSVSRLSNRRAQSYRCHRFHSSNQSENFYIWWVEKFSDFVVMRLNNFF